MVLMTQLANPDILFIRNLLDMKFLDYKTANA